MPTVEFLRPRLRGQRFQDAAIPLEVLKDLAVVEEMVIEVAKWCFLQENTDRVRSPRGFTRGIELKLTAVEDGSAIPVIALFIATTQLPIFAPPNQVYFERARDAIVNAISAAEHGRPVDEYLPEKALGYFDRLGRSLREGETIEFPTTSPDGAPARLTRESRRRLVMASPRMKEFSEEVTLRGAIPEADQDKMTFEIQLIDETKISAPIPDQHFDTIIEAFNGYRNGDKVLLQGIGRYNRQSRLVGFESVEHISILDPLDVPARLDDLRALRNGWLEGEGVAPSSKGLDWLSETFERQYPNDLVLPHVYPTPDGDVRVEWSLGRVEVSLEIDLESHFGEWHSFNLDSHAVVERTLTMDDDNDWTFLIDELRATGEEAQ